MTRFILPIILIGIGVAVFFMFSNPIYGNINELRTQVASYNEALDNSKALEKARDELTFRYNAIDKDDLTKLQKLLPNNVDNIRLILEIEQIAIPYGMALKDIKYSATDKTKSATGGTVATVQGGEATQISNKNYGIWDLEFSTTGTYNNFLNFTRDLENNLRIVDISSIQFSSNVASGTSSTSGSSSSVESYKYDFKIKTYWLKN